MKEDSWRRKKEEEEGSDDESSDDEPQQKGAGLIDVENPNRVANKLKKADDDLTGADGNVAKPELSRREREAIEKEQARLRYEKLHAEGKTDEARADLARLAIIKKERADAAAKKEEEKKMKEDAGAQAEAERRKRFEEQAAAEPTGKAGKKGKKKR